MDPLELLAIYEKHPVAFIEVVFIMIFLVSLFLFFGATAAGITDVTAFKVFLAAISVTAVQWSVVVVLSFIPTIGGILGFIFSILAMVYVLKVNFGTSWESAAKVWVLAIIAELSAGLILKLFLGIDITFFIHEFFFVS